MRYAVIDANGVVVNVIEADEGFTLDGFTLVLDDGSAKIGGTYSGTEFLPPDEMPPVPASVSRAQALIALHNAGLLEAVKTFIAEQEDAVLTLWFENALTWDRGNAYVQAIGAELDLDDDEIDDLFRAAAALT